MNQKKFLMTITKKISLTNIIQRIIKELKEKYTKIFLNLKTRALKTQMTISLRLLNIPRNTKKEKKYKTKIIKDIIYQQDLHLRLLQIQTLQIKVKMKKAKNISIKKEKINTKNSIQEEEMKIRMMIMMKRMKKKMKLHIKSNLNKVVILQM